VQSNSFGLLFVILGAAELFPRAVEWLKNLEVRAAVDEELKKLPLVLTWSQSIIPAQRQLLRVIV
jgi:hypothetical protein